MNFTYERLTFDNLHRLVPMYEKVYRKRVSLQYLQQKFDARYLHPKLFGYFALHESEPVAVTTAIPYMLQHKGVAELTVQSLDSITMPGFQGKGLFTKLSNMLFADLQPEGITCIWGFPNKNSEIIYTKLSWSPGRQVNGYRIPVLNRYPAYLLRFGNKAIYGDNAAQKVCSKILTSDRPEASFAGTDYVCTVRDNGFYNYKRFGNNFCIVINGKRVWLKQAGSLNIGEIDPLNDDEVLPLITELKKYAVKAGAPYIFFQTSSGTVNDAVFQKHFEKFESWKIGYKNVCSKLPLEKLSVTWADMDTF